MRYDDIPNKVGYDENCDFMEVVLVELPRMKDTQLKEEAALVSLLYSKEDAIDKIEEMLPIKLERAGKEIREAMTWEQRTQEYVDEAKKEGRKETAIQFLEMMDAESIKKNLDQLEEFVGEAQVRECLARKGVMV